MEKRKPKNESADNPFSFRNFLTTPYSSGNTSEPSSSNGATSNVTAVNDNYSPFSNRRRDGNERLANPYSFARFIQNPVLSSRVDNGLLLQGELPDFVQDHFSASNVDSNHRNGLPDFTFHTHHETGSPPAPISPASSPDDLFTSHMHEDNTRFTISTSANLPDFLSDTGINIIPNVNDQTQISDVSISTVSLSNVNGIPSDSVDDEEMSARLAELGQESSQKSIRILQLEQQLSEQKRKEEEDTEVMETMMRQVDENLAKAVVSELNYIEHCPLELGVVAPGWSSPLPLRGGTYGQPVSATLLGAIRAMGTSATQSASCLSRVSASYARDCGWPPSSQQGHNARSLRPPRVPNRRPVITT